MKTRARYFAGAAIIFWALLALVPGSALAWMAPPEPDPNSLLPALQKAAGKGWSVAVISRGYAITSAKAFSFLPDASPGTKMDFNQRLGVAVRKRITIKVLFTPPDTNRQLVSRHVADDVLPIVEAENGEGYFSCFQSGDGDFYSGQCLDGPKYALFLFANISPYESVHPQDESDEYELTIHRLLQIFGDDSEQLFDHSRNDGPQD